MQISRRRVLAGLGSSFATTVALQACNGGNTGPGSFVPSTSATYDLIIVGAGCAGISAARTARTYGANILVLEAQNYIGGRAKTDTTTFSEIGFDLGAQFFQECLNGNEMYDIAHQEGLTILDSAGGGPQATPPSLATAIMSGTMAASLGDVGAFVVTTLAVKDAILAAGSAIALGASADLPVSTTLSLQSGDMWFNPVVSQAVNEVVGSLNASTLDLYTYTNAEPFPFATPGSDFIVKSGMGTFVQSLAKGIPIVLNSPVSSIATGGSTVAVTANGATYHAKTVIVTASTNVLAKSNTTGGIQFTPALPTAYMNAFAQLPMIPVFKALMGFKPSFQFNVPGFGQAFSVVLPLTNAEISTFFPNFWNTNTCEFIANGTLATTLDAAGPAGAAPILLAQLETTFQGATAAWDGRITASSWLSNPHVLGAYSAAVVGGFPARAVIAQPIGNQLWFAGEAVSSAGDRGTLLAAYRSGAAAATGALKTIGLAQHLRRR